MAVSEDSLLPSLKGLERGGGIKEEKGFSGGEFCRFLTELSWSPLPSMTNPFKPFPPFLNQESESEIFILI